MDKCVYCIAFASDPGACLAICNKNFVFPMPLWYFRNLANHFHQQPANNDDCYATDT